MKARAGLIASVLIFSIFNGTCKARNVDRDKNDERSKTDTFAKYYEPYEPNIKPNAPGYKLPLDINEIVNFNDVVELIPASPGTF